MGALKSKTLWAAALIAALGVVQSSTDALQAVMTPKIFGVVMIVIGALMAGLRIVTTQSLAEKSETEGK